MAFDLTKPSMTDADWSTFAGNIRENFRALAQGDGAVWQGQNLSGYMAASGKGFTLYDSAGGTTYETLEIGSNRTDADATRTAAVAFFAQQQSASHKAIVAFDVYTDGATANVRGGQLRFSTKPNNSTTMTERLRIDSQGYVQQSGASYLIGNGMLPSGSNYERIQIGYLSNVAKIFAEAAGTGTARNLQLTTGANTGIVVDTAGNVGINVSSLSARLTVGAGGTGTNTEELRIASGNGTGGVPYITFYKNATRKGYVGTEATGGGQLVVNGASDDLVIGSVQRMLFTADNGSNIMGQLSAAGSWVFGKLAALTTTATDGFVYVPTSAGAPTGVPTGFTGKVAMEYDTTNNRLYVYNGAWKSVVLA